MRKIFFLIALLVPVSAFALSCPNNGSMLKASDSISTLAIFLKIPISFKLSLSPICQNLSHIHT